VEQVQRWWLRPLASFPKHKAEENQQGSANDLNLLSLHPPGLRQFCYQLIQTHARVSRHMFGNGLRPMLDAQVTVTAACAETFDERSKKLDCADRLSVLQGGVVLHEDLCAIFCAGDASSAMR